MKKLPFLPTLGALFFTVCQFTVLEAQWQRVTAPGSIPVINMQKIGPRLELATAFGAFYSEDDGLVWHKHFNAPGTSIRNQQATYYVYSSANVEFFKSTDLGTTWVSIAENPGFLGQSITDFTVLNDTIFATNSFNVWRNDPGSSTWTVVYQNPQVGDLRLSNANGYVWITKKQILRSSDQGTTWQNVTPASVNISGTSIHGDTILATIQGGTGTYFSANSGQSWVTRGNPPAGTLYFSDGAYTLRNNYNVYLSKDEGYNWKKVYSYPYIPNCAAYSNGIILLGMPNGFMRSVDEGDNYLYSNADLISTPESNPLFSLTTVGNLTVTNSGLLTFDKGDHWFGPFLPGGIDDWEQKADTLYALTAVYKLLHRSHQSISQWDTVLLDSIPGTIEHLIASSDALYLTTLTTMTGLAQPIYRSTDNGQSWSLQGEAPVYAIDFIASDSILFCLTSAGDIYVSSDKGLTWNLKVDGIGYPINDIFVSENFVYAYRYNSIQGVFYVSTDYGESWTLIPPTYDRSVSYAASGNKVFIDDIFGRVYVITGPDDTWTLINDNLPNDLKESAMAVQGQTLLLMDTKLKHFYRRDLNTLITNVIKGVVFNDLNQNSSRDPQEPGLPYQYIQAVEGERFTSSGTNGTFQLTTEVLPDTLRIFPLSPYAQVTPAFHVVSGAIDSQYQFAIRLQPGVVDLQADLSLTTVLQPGFTIEYVLTVTNIGTDTVPAIVKLWLNPALSVVETTPPFDHITNDTIFWSSRSFFPQTRQGFRVRAKVSTGATIGAEIPSIGYVWPDSMDIAPNDNISSRRDSVYAAFDPNFKESSPVVLVPDDIAVNRPITYTIHFQNTGNYPATIVKVTDTLSTHLDPTTFHLVASSHPVQTDVEGSGILVFTFNNINLPDSTRDETASHGFVKFLITPRSDLSIGDSITNQASIYFDYNSAIFTNQNIIRVSQLSFTQDIPHLFSKLLSAFPNPFRDVLQVEIREMPNEPWKIYLIDMTGRIVFSSLINGYESTVNVAGLQSGSYLAVACTAEGRLIGVTKVIKQQ